MQRYKSIALVSIAIGLGLQAWLLVRSGVGADQVALLQLGLDMQDGIDPIAKQMSGGGRIPGSMLQLMVGVPLALWHSVLAVKVLIWLMSAISFVPLWNALKDRVSPAAFATFFLVFALSPWRVYQGALMWEPAYLFLPAAIHLWASLKSMDARSFTASFALGCVLLVLPQLHGSFLILWITTALLLFKKRLGIHWPGLLAGGLIGGASFLPYIQSFGSVASTSAPADGFIGKGLLTIAPLLKGLLYWPRLGSLDIGVPLKEVTFSKSIFVIILQIFGIASIVPAVVCSWCVLIRGRANTSSNPVKLYSLMTFLGLLIAAALSPITLQGWHVIIALHAACVPVALGLIEGPTWLTRWRTYVTIVISVLAVAINIALALGKPTFNKEAPPKELFDHPQIQELLSAPN